MVLQSIKKELIIVFRDLHSVAVLLLMPVIFMLIMTFAMSERQSDVISNITVNTAGMADDDQGLYLKYLAKFGYQVAAAKENADVQLQFRENFTQQIFTDTDTPLVDVEYSDNTSPTIKAIVGQHLQLAFARLKLHLYWLESGEMDEDLPLEEQMSLISQQTETAHYISVKSELNQPPAVAYSVPSWLIFGVYFIVLPISVTLLNEIQNGTLIRLKTFPVNLTNYFFVKLLAFYVLSLGQYLVLNFIGWRLVPILIDIPPVPFSHIWELIVIGLVICFSAVSFAAIIAILVKSFEQAIVVGGGINILLAAISGFMVPFDIMPHTLQQIAQYSPMYWSANLVKSSAYGGLQSEHWMNVLYLCIFTAISLLLSAALFKRKIRNLTWN